MHTNYRSSRIENIRDLKYHRNNLHHKQYRAHHGKQLFIEHDVKKSKACQYKVDKRFTRRYNIRFSIR